MSSETSYENGRLTVTRFFNAPQAAVFDAWIKTSKIKLWWGCEGATIVHSHIEPRVGGKYIHEMTIDGVGEHRHHGRVTEFDPPRLLVYELSDRFHDKLMLVRVEFVEQGDGTKVCLTQNNLLDLYVEFVRAGWSFSFEKLATLLEETDETGNSVFNVFRQLP